MNIKALDRNRCYEAAELEEMLGRKLACECAPLAIIRGRYWGGTIMDYLDEVGQRRIQELMKPKSGIDKKPRSAHTRTHDTASRGNSRSRYYKDTEP